MNIRAKFALTAHKKFSVYGGRFSNTFTFTPQYDTSIPEDQRFSQATPSGEFTMVVDNPVVVEYFSKNLGKQFYVDFREAPSDKEE